MLRPRPSDFGDLHLQLQAGPPQAADAEPLVPPRRVQLADGRPPLLAPTQPQRARAPREALVLRTSSGETRTITRPTRVGSGADNDWILADPYVSQHHA